MPCSQPFRDVTQKYLCRFREILENMMTGMTEAEITDSLSHNFIVQMIPHHRAAIEMSQNLLQYTTLLPLQKIAQEIIKEQTESIQHMREMLPCCSRQANSQQDLCLYEKNSRQIAHNMFSQMKNARSCNDINANFIREMIPHHEGAIRLSINALRYPICPELLPVLQSIVKSQERGIRRMKRLLRHGG